MKTPTPRECLIEAIETAEHIASDPAISQELRAVLAVRSERWKSALKPADCSNGLPDNYDPIGAYDNPG